MNNLGAVSYIYMKEQEFSVLTFQSKWTQSHSALETKQQATLAVTNVATVFLTGTMLLLASFRAEASKVKSL